MMMNNKDVYTKAVDSLRKTQAALMQEISIADGRSRVHAPTFYYVSEAIKQIQELKEEAAVEAKLKAAKEVKPTATKAV